jgi:beta-glucosidase
VDIIMVSADWRGMLAALDEAVTRALIPLARIDDAVRRILWVKEQAGLFERPRPAQRPAVIAHATAPIVGSTAHRAVARSASARLRSNCDRGVSDRKRAARARRSSL